MANNRNKRTFNREALTPEQLKIALDRTIPSDVASFMLNEARSNIVKLRHEAKLGPEGLAKLKASLKKASKKFREKMKQQNKEKFGKQHNCYNYWKPEEIEYILTSEEPDLVIAEKLNRTVYSIQKKRERILKENEENEPKRFHDRKSRPIDGRGLQKEDSGDVREECGTIQETQFDLECEGDFGRTKYS